MSKSSGYHIGIIMDGNGRWAKERGKPRLFGHAAGEQTTVRIIKACPENDVHTLSIYAFAVANWTRDEDEVAGIWDIFRTAFTAELPMMQEMGARLHMIGDRSRIPKDVLGMVEEAEALTKDNAVVTVNIALSYDGVDEVVRAVRAAAKKIVEGELRLEDIDAHSLLARLDTSDSPLPDIIIRTGMPQKDNERGMAIWRSSSFLQLQSAQAVCVSTPVLWPDFTPEDLSAAIRFAKPDERLFGGQRK